MSKPRLLDLFCGAGGAAMGYSRAGFEILGVDIKPQPNYPFRFVQIDAIGFLRGLWPEHDFVAVHASPPCQFYSQGTVAIDRSKYPVLVGPIREALIRSGLPYIIENVPRAPLLDPMTICGAAMGLLATDDDGQSLVLKRHRLFETSFPLKVPDCDCKWYRDHNVRVGGVYGGGRRDKDEAKFIRHGGYCPRFEVQQNLMGIDWMSQTEMNQAIPPAYTKFIGDQLMGLLGALLSLNESKEGAK
jgi:DNA (cytosine-5)-methyltransferase 1